MDENSKNTENVTVIHDEPKKEEKSHHTSHKHHAASSHGHKSSAKGTELTKTFWQYLSFGLAALLLLSLIWSYDLNLDISKTSGSGSVAEVAAGDSAGSGSAGAAVAVAYEASDYYDDDDPMIGDPDAPVTIVEFSDFQCPFCERFYSQTYLSLKENYVDTGKVKIVFRDFPLSFHPEAEPAALAAECANEQGEFWAFHDLIFENQGSMSASAYLEWAAEIGLDVGQFSECVDSQKYKSEVASDYNDGGRLGVTGTPGFFVNGELVTGAQPYAVFAAAIDAQLAK
jgi:protein-disulfide isomerase